MTIYQDVFGGANIYPSDVSYRLLTLTSNITLVWPEESATSENIASRIMDLSAASGGWVVTLPDARGSGVGETILFNNTGAASVIISDALGVQVVTTAPGTVWQVYLTNNSTQDGAWATLQYGSAVSEADASSLAGTGIVAVSTTLSPAIPVSSFNTDITLGVASRAKLYVWTSAAGNMHLPLPGTVGDNWFVFFRNSGTGALVVDPEGVSLIDGLATKSFQPGESATIISDGTSYCTVGYGQAADFVFDYTSVNIAGTGSYTLAGGELNRVAYSFTGALTGDRTVVVPATIQQYWVTNSTTNAFALTVKTAAGTGIVVAQGASVILYSNGTNVVQADTAGATYPISVAQGGTGATTASAALNNLGSGALGVALFAASNEATAWAALGNSPLISGGAF